MPPHGAFSRVASRLLHTEPPCMSEAEDWESSAGFLAEEHLAKPRQSTPDRLHLERTLTLASGAAQGAGQRWVPEGERGAGQRRAAAVASVPQAQAYGSRRCRHAPAAVPPISAGISRLALHCRRPPAAAADEAGLNTGLRSEGVAALRRAWESSQRSTKEDWAEWMRNFSIALLKQSPRCRGGASGGWWRAD